MGDLAGTEKLMSEKPPLTGTTTAFPISWIARSASGRTQLKLANSDYGKTEQTSAAHRPARSAPAPTQAERHRPPHLGLDLLGRQLTSPSAAPPCGPAHPKARRGTRRAPLSSPSSRPSQARARSCR